MRRAAFSGNTSARRAFPSVAAVVALTEEGVDMARVVVIGGTGFTGSRIVREAAGRGHEVVSLSRSVPAEEVDGVEYSTGSAADAGALITGADVVVGALSPRGDNAGALVDVYARIADQAAQADARLVVVGGFSSLRPTAGAPRFAEGDDLPPQFAGEAREMNAVLGALSATPETLDWLFVSPAATYGAYAPPSDPRGEYRVGQDVALFDADGESLISGEDFATAVVDEIESPTRRRAQIHFAY
jgi:uncharacterized protein